WHSPQPATTSNSPSLSPSAPTESPRGRHWRCRRPTHRSPDPRGTRLRRPLDTHPLLPEPAHHHRIGGPSCLRPLPPPTCQSLSSGPGQPVSQPPPTWWPEGSNPSCSKLAPHQRQQFSNGATSVSSLRGSTTSIKPHAHCSNPRIGRNPTVITCRREPNSWATTWNPWRGLLS